MKKKYLVGGILLAFLALTGCAKDNTPTTVKSLPLYNYNAYYDLKENTIDTYYLDDSLVPYVSVEGYINSMNGFLDSEQFKYSSNTLFNEYVVKTTMKKASSTPMSIIFDYKNDKILSAYDYPFRNTVDIEDTIDYSFNLKSKLESYYTGKTIILDLAKYNFDIHYINGNCLVPFQVMNALFGGMNYNSTFYTGKAYYNTYFSPSYSNDAKTLLAEMKANVSSDIDSEELRESNYNFMCFYLDYFYGLKDRKDITSFDSYLTEDIKANLKSTDSSKYEAGYAALVQKLNEEHTSIHSFGYTFTGSISNTEGTYATESFVKSRQTSLTLAPLARAHYGNELKNQIEIKDDTCFIFFRNFKTGDNNVVKDENNNVLEDAYLNDTYYLFVKAFDEIKKSSTPIKNIVVDLSINGGGNAGALYRTLGFVSRKFNVTTRDALTKTVLTYSYEVDTNNDGQYDINDGYSDYNWYVLTSNYTYSSANIFSYISKASNSNVKIIGEQAGGGGCSILPFVLIDGTALQISGTNQSIMIASTRGTSYEYVVLEDGPSVDLEISYDKYYDREFITNLISSL